MIPNQWYIILESREVSKNQVIGVRRLGENLVVWRNSQGKLGAAIDKCPHRGIALSKGKVKNDNLECPFHGFQYDPGGKCKLIPANGKAASVVETHQPMPSSLKMNENLISGDYPIICYRKKRAELQTAKK